MVEKIFLCTHWHELARTVTQCRRQVCAVFAHGSRKWHEINACQEFWTFQNSLHDVARSPALLTHSSRTPHAPLLSLHEPARSNAFQLVNQIRASVNAALHAVVLSRVKTAMSMNLPPAYCKPAYSAKFQLLFCCTYLALDIFWGRKTLLTITKSSNYLILTL